MLKTMLAAVAVGAALSLGACGGGGGAAADQAPPASADVEPTTPVGEGDGNIVVKRIDGPLDVVQARLDTASFAPLLDAAEDTPLEALLSCTDQVVAHNLLDISDSVLIRLQQSQLDGGSTTMEPDARDLTVLLGNLAGNLTQLLQALAGRGSGCAGGDYRLEQIGFQDNPLAATPFEPLASALGPLLAQVGATVDRHDQVQGDIDDLSVDQLADLLTHIDYAMQLGLQQVPAEVFATPVVGGVLNTVATALTDNTAVLEAVLSHDPQSTARAVRIQLEHSIANVLIDVLPVRALENQAGQPGLISRPIRASVAALGATQAGSPGAAAALGDVFAPIETQLLPTLLAPLDLMLAAAKDGGPDPTNPLVGTALAAPIDAVGAVVDGLLTGSGGADCRYADLPMLAGLCRSM